ncbi:glycosyltransferase [Massilia oculi]|uniref:glycosyltransferase n=1 Tax=Massilia oculi TaxID=945844 RepID=UPI001AAEE123|nr:glycosyltransferase [Massilia oculi]
MKKIAWCTPFSTASSISEFSHTLVESHNSDPSSNSNFEIDIFVNENGHRYRSTSTCFEIKQFLKSSDSIRLFKDHYDHVFYNLGNNKENHQEIFELSNIVPGVAILHDYVYQHYLAGRIFSDCNAPSVYAYLMGRHYGESGLKSVHASQILGSSGSRIGLWDTDLTSEFPMIEAIVNNPLHKGVVVHSGMARRAVEKAYDGPILQLRLPGDEKESLSPETILRWKNETSRRRRVTIGVIGHIQRGKQIHRLLESIFSAPLLADLIQTVIIAGKPSDKEYVESLKRMIAEHPQGSLISLELNVTHGRLQEIKEISDFFVNMRYPNTEGGSGSLVEQMACNKPVVVLNSGIFAEVSKGVIKVDSIEDRAAMHDAIYELASSPERRIELGNEAREYAQSYMSKDYITDIIKFSESIRLHERSNGASSLHEILLYDKETRGPEPIFDWSANAFLEFLKIVFQQYFEPGFIDHLALEREMDPINTYKQYSFARTIISLIESSARGDECKTWLFPKNLSADNSYILASLKEKYYLMLAAAFSCVENPSISQWGSLCNRFTAISQIERFALVLAAWNSEGSEKIIKKLQGREEENIPAKFIEVIKLAATLPDESFGKLLLGEWRKILDTKQYQNSYADLAVNKKLDHESLVKHYEDHGREEKRIARVSSNQLMLIMRNA